MKKSILEMKKNNPLITVVIPCYHVEDVIGCIFSDLKKQSFSDFEMVFVNDGGVKRCPPSLVFLQRMTTVSLR